METAYQQIKILTIVNILTSTLSFTNKVSGI